MRKPPTPSVYGVEQSWVDCSRSLHSDCLMVYTRTSTRLVLFALQKSSALPISATRFRNYPTPPVGELWVYLDSDWKYGECRKLTDSSRIVFQYQNRYFYYRCVLSCAVQSSQRQCVAGDLITAELASRGFRWSRNLKTDFLPWLFEPSASRLAVEQLSTGPLRTLLAGAKRYSKMLTVRLALN